jgi:hypothetical protein
VSWLFGEVGTETYQEARKTDKDDSAARADGVGLLGTAPVIKLQILSVVNFFTNLERHKGVQNSR